MITSQYIREVATMKKLIPLLLAAVLILSSCGTGNGLDGMAASFEPPLRITARITS